MTVLPFLVTALLSYCDNTYCVKLLTETVFVIHKGPTWLFDTVKSSVIVTFAYCDNFLWS